MRKEPQTANKVLPKAGLNGFDWAFVQVSTFVLRIKCCAKKPPTTPSPKTLALTLKDDTTDDKRTVKRQTKCQPFAKLKVLQADTQANAFAAHLILPNRTQAHPPP
jgi:hypothetical protein